MMAKITKAVKRRYELLAVRWASSKKRGDTEETDKLKAELLKIENETGMTAGEILKSAPVE